MTDLYHFSIKRFGALIRHEEQSLGDGNAKDFAEYKQRCGKIAGLKTAINEFRDLHKREMGGDYDETDYEDDL